MSNEELVKQIQQGQEELLETFWEQNKALVYHVVKKYQGVAELEDLMQEGYIGLHKAVFLFDTAANILFVTYAVPSIQRTVKRYLYESRLVRVPEYMKRLVYEWQQYETFFLQKEYREPTEEEIRRGLKINKRTLQELKSAIRSEKITSLDVPVGEEAETTMLDLIKCPRNNIEAKERQLDYQYISKELWSAIEELEQPYRTILQGRYQRQATRKELGALLEKSESEIVTLEQKALKKLRYTPQKEVLQSYTREYLGIQKK